MSKIDLVKGSCLDQKADVTVNAANKFLADGGGIAGATFGRAGRKELAAECAKHKTPLKDGEAVITSACNMKSFKAIIHAVGPNFGVTPTAFKELFEAYYNSLVVLMENGYHSISFPLISSSIFGGDLPDPVDESTKQCLHAYRVFTRDYPDYDVEVKLCAFTDKEYASAAKRFSEDYNG